jgi:hypothetical protein
VKITIRRHPGARHTDSTFELDCVGPVTVIDTEASHVELEETYVGPIFKTADGACLAVFMRDDGFEANCWRQDPAVMIDPDGALPADAVSFSVSPESGLHVQSRDTPISGGTRTPQPEAMLGYATNRELLTELECRWSMGSTHPDYSTMTSDQFPTDEYTDGDLTVVGRTRSEGTLHSSGGPVGKITSIKVDERGGFTIKADPL